MAEQDDGAAVQQFQKAVNMTPAQIEKWLATEHSQEVGQKADGAGESTRHHSGRRILEILHKNKADYTADDVAHMRKVVGYLHRRLAQHPSGDVQESHWRYSPMNWGHAPLND